MIPTGKQVRAAREAAGLSRRQLAGWLTMSEHQLLNVEKGRRLSADEAEQLGQVLWENFSIQIGNEGVERAALAEADPLETPTVTGQPVGGAQVVPRARSWSGSTQTSVPLGPIRTGDVRQVSNSEVQSFLDCRRRWWLAWYRGLTPTRESPLGARAIGDRVHRALQCWYVPEGEARTTPAAALERLIVEDWSVIVEQGLDTPDMQKQFNSEANLERAMVEGYSEWLEETGEDVGLTVVAPETYVEARLLDGEETPDGRPVDAIAKIDVRVTREVDGVRRVIDHKTMAEFARARARLRLGDPQMLHYHLVEWLSTEEGEARCAGALYNMLRRVRRTASAKPPYYERIPIDHNQAQVDSYRRQLTGIVDEMLEVEADLAAGADHQRVVYPHKTNDCSWKCEFNGVCPMFDDGSRAEAMLAQLYTVRDPMDYYNGANAPSNGQETQQ
jgi:transcriptional regulator with XRE-family HTH domain